MCDGYQGVSVGFGGLRAMAKCYTRAAKLAAIASPHLLKLRQRGQPVMRVQDR